MKQDNTLEEETIRSGGLCGSTFVDQEFLKFLSYVVGYRALEDFKREHYGSLQKLIYKFFCPEVKLPFNDEEFETIELDLEAHCPALIPYIGGRIRDKLEDEDWVIDLKFEDVKKMFDPSINKIVDLINAQIYQVERLPRRRRIKTMFLVGGFSESAYLFKRIKGIFMNRIPKIITPPQPIAAVAKGMFSSLNHFIYFIFAHTFLIIFIFPQGACYYGLNKNIIKIKRI